MTDSEMQFYNDLKKSLEEMNKNLSVFENQMTNAIWDLSETLKNMNDAIVNQNENLNKTNEVVSKTLNSVFTLTEKVNTIENVVHTDIVDMDKALKTSMEYLDKSLVNRNHNSKNVYTLGD